MSKKHLYFSEAERMYVIEQMTFAEIASDLNLADKTLRLWAAEGTWQNKRKQYLLNKQTFHEELYLFARKLMQSISEDMSAGKKVDPGRMYAFTRMLPLITKVKDYEDVMSEGDKESKAGLTKEAVEIIQKEILGF